MPPGGLTTGVEGCAATLAAKALLRFYEPMLEESQVIALMEYLRTTHVAWERYSEDWEYARRVRVGESLAWALAGELPDYATVLIDEEGEVTVYAVKGRRLVVASLIDNAFAARLLDLRNATNVKVVMPSVIEDHRLMAYASDVSVLTFEVDGEQFRFPADARVRNRNALGEALPVLLEALRPE